MWWVKESKILNKFTTEEIETIVSEVEAKKKFSILFKSVSAGVTMVKKNEAWATITETVTIVSSETQTVAQVKKKRFNVKANSKQTQLEYKGHLICQT